MFRLSRRICASQGVSFLRVWYGVTFYGFFDGLSCPDSIGHKWCSSCAKKHEADPQCGECRQSKGKPHRIYLDLEELVDDQVVLVSDGLNAINMDSSPSDIEAFNLTVRKLCQKPN